MNTKVKIENLKNSVESALTFEVEGRQTVAKSCKDLYDTIEDGLYEKFGDNALVDAYEDLCEGNFSEPFLAEKQKEKFQLYASIYCQYVLKS